MKTLQDYIEKDLPVQGLEDTDLFFGSTRKVVFENRNRVHSRGSICHADR